MAAWLPSIPYPPEQEGYWAPITATLDWCEENYYATQYSAEIVNSMTNLLFAYLAIKGISNCIINGHDRIFIVSFLGYLVVGVGSFLFHSTLKYPMQLIDELSMIYTTCIMFYATFAHNKSTRYITILAGSLITLSVSITAYYHYLKDPIFHQVVYAILTAIVLIRALYVMEINIRPSLRMKETALRSDSADSDTKPRTRNEQRRIDDRDAKILRTMWIMIAYGLSAFLGGFAVWNLDNVFCPTLRTWRRKVGLPWGILLEGHGWWHLMTGIGAYYYIVWGIWLRHCLNHKQDDYELYWPRLLTSMPSVVRKRGHNQAAIANGKKKR
ncbi:dihydroceramidase [Trichodelitschia bisporula]|uniref:Dihydroceramidase n=1 Tax=Trichodelitschia bisporula TaxID=703511 RepID=A0A6G1HYU6_9PEZI|nr:dihydroceramidase [Trichodelitschia bisporula]